MTIKYLAIRKYRSFDKEVWIPLTSFSVITGQNNLGKSAILRALSLFYRSHSRAVRNTLRDDSGERYSYEADYPKLYSGKKGRRYNTRFRLGIELTLTDVSSLKVDGVDIPSGKIEIVLEMVKGPGLWRSKYSCDAIKDPIIFEKFLTWFFLNSRYVYIPANRGTGEWKRILFREVVSGAAQGIKNRRKKLKELEAFYVDIKNVIKDVESDLVKELRGYSKEANSIKFILEEPDIESLVSIEDVMVDDGVETGLSQKGDGVKSLFVISVLQFLAKKGYTKNLMFGIEEPEAHLHSSAIYDIKTRLRELSGSFQIIITTHSPILIQRDNISDNIVVEKINTGKFSCSARPASNISDVRNALGVKLHENLISAEVVIVTEGATEAECLGALIIKTLPGLSGVFDAGRVRVINAGGASKTLSIVRALARDATVCITMLDSDDAGGIAADEIKKSGLVGILDVFNVPQRLGCLETEFEDIFSPAEYLPIISADCAIPIDEAIFSAERARSGGSKTKHKKWSEVMESIVNKCGKQWNAVENDIKSAFAKAVKRPSVTLGSDEALFVKSIGARIEAHLKINR
jgi:putative ATP-dependent endonuclease of OLD family